MSKELQDLEKKIESGEMSLKDIPAGYKRDEVIAKKKDLAEEKGEKMTENVAKISDKHIKPEREIQHQIRRNFLDIRVPGCHVCWVNYVNQHGMAVWSARSDGWIVVTRDMVAPEDRDLCREDNTFKVGDVMAMCIPEEQYQENQGRLFLKAQAELEGEFTSELHELRKKSPKAFNIIDNNSTGANASNIRNTMQHRAAQKMALGHIGNKMKQGTIPGIPIK